MLGRFAVVAVLALYSIAAKKLTLNGTIAAVVVGIIHCLGPSDLPIVLLTVFFLLGTAATKVKAAKKAALVHATESQSTRSAEQVLSNSLAASVLLAYAAVAHDYSPQIYQAVAAHYAAMTADTLSSELGILATTQPMLVTSGKRVPRGTNGGVTGLGLLFALIGSAIIGFVAKKSSDLSTDSVMSIVRWGVIGSLLDSLLGATVQASITDPDGKVYEGATRVLQEGPVISGTDILTNNQVNLAMASLVTIGSLYFWGKI